MAGKILSVLLVEDNPADAFFIQELLEDVRGMQISLRHVEQLSEALALLRAEDFDLLLLDLSLPDAHGVETVSLASAAARDVAMVVLTGLDDEDTAIRAMQEGAQDYLVKGTVDAPLLRRSIRYALERKRAEDNIRRLIEEQLARSEAEVAERRSRFLAEASHLLASSVDYEATLGRVANLTVASWADRCMVDLIQSGTEVRRLALEKTDGAQPPLHPRHHRLDGGDLVARVLHTGEPLLISELPGSGTRLDVPSGWQAPSRSVLCVPLIVRGRPLGALTILTRQPGRPLKSGDLAVALELAGRAALAIENAQLHRGREEVLRVVSHDLRNPLSVMRGNLELLGLGDIPLEQALATLNRATLHMDRLIQDLLDATRLDAGTLSLRLQRVGVATLLEQADEMLRPTAESRGLQLQIPEPQGLPFLHADRDRVLQVFWNLVGNAIKFTPSGGTVRISVDAVGEAVRFAVSDTGPGIPEKDAARVFERFWQGSKDDRRGAGLGLSIAKGLIEAHGGKIWLTSVEQQGSTFFFTLPLAEALPEPVAQPKPVVQAKRFSVA